MYPKLSKDGYIIQKTDYSASKIKEIRDDLTVKPYVGNDFGNVGEKKFTLYMESPNKLYLPRYYGIKQLGDASINKLIDPKEICIDFKGSLRKEQEPIYNQVKEQLDTIGGGIISI